MHDSGLGCRWASAARRWAAPRARVDNLCECLLIVTNTMMMVRDALPSDAPAVADIYNQGIDDRGATFETEPRDASDITAWFADHDRFPTLVAVDNDIVLGWARLSSYRTRACYAGIAEFSIYIDR